MTDKGQPEGSGPKFEAVGPTVDDDIRRLIARYGMKAFKEASARHTKAKRGRKAVADWRDLDAIIDADARSWLAGGDPFSERTNYSIAKDFSEREPAHYREAAHERIERKLRKERALRTLTRAVTLTMAGPAAAHIRALEALAATPGAHEVWKQSLEIARAGIELYQMKYGQSPPPELSAFEVREQTRNALERLVPSNSPKNSVIGLLSQPYEGPARKG